MIRDDTQKLVDRLQERFDAVGCAMTASVAPQAYQVDFAAPGGGRPRIFRYRVKLTDATRVSMLELDEAEALLETVSGAAPQGWDAERVFAAVAAQGLAVDPIGATEPVEATDRPE